MIDREKVLAVLHKRFPGSTPDQIAAAANAIVGLEDEWVDVTDREPQMGYSLLGPVRRDLFSGGPDPAGGTVPSADASTVG